VCVAYLTGRGACEQLARGRSPLLPLQRDVTSHRERRDVTPQREQPPLSPPAVHSTTRHSVYRAMRTSSPAAVRYGDGTTALHWVDSLVYSEPQTLVPERDFQDVA